MIARISSALAAASKRNQNLTPAEKEFCERLRAAKPNLSESSIYLLMEAARK